MQSEASRRDLAAAHEANLEAFHAFGTEILVRTERLLTLNLDFARGFTEQSLARAEDIRDAKSQGDVFVALPKAMRPEMERAIDYARQVGEIVADGQRECLDIGKTWLTNINVALERLLSDAVRTAPAGSEPVLAAMRSALDLSKDLYDRMSAPVSDAADRLADAVATSGEEAQPKPVRRGAASKTAADESN